ncbi:reverse transcriptase domain-containing protein [Tanacetum coccineum]
MRTRSSLEYTIPRRRNRRRSRQQQEAIPIVDKDSIPMADDRPMAEQLQAPTGGFESAIVVPLINAQNFELKSSLINLVQNRIFRGGNDEEPHAHIRHFESITNNQRYPDVPNTTIKLLLFPFSLDGVAKTWLDKEPPNSILTWDDLVSKFINFFFPPSKTTNLRNEITNFRQIAQESFSEAWERFKELLRKCPHHGFSLMHQLDTFYNSLSYNDQDSLNSAAGGNFLYKSPTEGLQIIENKAKVRCSRNAVMRVSTNAPPSSSSSSNFEFQQMAAALEDKMTLTFRNEMNEMKNMMKALVPTPVPIKAVEERCTTCGSNHSFNVCPMTRGGYEHPVYHDNFQQFQQTASVGNIPHQGMVPYQSPPQNSQIVLASQLDIFKKTTEGSMQVMRNHITNLKAEIRSEVQATLQNQINSLKGEFKNELKSQHNLFMNQQNNFQNNLQNMLSGFFQNQSQPSTSTSVAPTTLPSNTITNPRCEARAITTRSGLSYTPVPPIPPPLFDENESLTEKETEVTKDKVLPSTKDIQPPVIQKSHDPVKPVSSPISPEPSSAQVNNSPPSKEPSKETHLPYPSRVEYEKKGENDKVQIQKFWEMFKKIHVNITLADALILMPKYQKMLKSLLSNKEKLNEMANTPVSENCSAIILKKLPEKLEDPGRFLIPCTFSELKCKALADLVDFECDYRVPLILGGLSLRRTRFIIDVPWEELVIRDGMERIVFKPDGSQDKESIHMMDIYDDRFKDVCEPESDDSSSPTSTIVEEFDSLVGEIIKQKEEVKEISDPVARRRACFSKLENFRIIHQGRVIHSPKIASVSAISHIFPNNNLEDSFKMGDEDLNFIPNKELDKEDLIPIPRESKIRKECDFPLCDDFQSFKTFSNPLFEKKDDFPSRNDESILKEEVHKETLKSYLNPLFKDDEEIISIEVSRQISPKVDVKTIVSFFAPIGNCVRKWATSEFVKDNVEISQEVFKSDNENDLGVHDNEEEEIAFLDGLLENENFFEMNDKKVESLERKTKEDFETKDEPKSKKELQVVHPDIEILNHFETTSYVGSDYVFYEDFNLVDMIFPMNIQGKIFDPGITFHEKPFEKDAFKDKSSKELAPSKSLLTLDVFDPLHPPLIDFHVTKALSGFTFSLLKLFSKKFFEPRINNATVFRILEDSWFNIVEEQSNAHNFH